MYLDYKNASFCGFARFYLCLQQIWGVCSRGHLLDFVAVGWGVYSRGIRNLKLEDAV